MASIEKLEEISQDDLFENGEDEEVEGLDDGENKDPAKKKKKKKKKKKTG